MSKNLQTLLDQQENENYKSHYTFSDETRAKLSEASKRRWEDPVFRAKMEEVTRDGSSQETKEKISASKKGVTAHNKGKGKRMMTPHGEFPSGSAVAQAAGVRMGLVYEWMALYPKDFYYIDKQRLTISQEFRANMGAPKGVRTGRPVTTPLGNFANTTEAAQAHNKATGTIQLYMRDYPELYYYTKEV
jgi:hypothetical protein